MKIYITLCVALVFHGSYSLPVAEEVAQQAQTAECQAVDFVADFNQFVTNQMRVALCSQEVAHYNASGRIQARYLGEEYNNELHENPCRVVCYNDEATEAVAQSAYTRNEYFALPNVKTANLAEHTVCGPAHTCDAHGCCIQEPVHVEPETHEEPPAETHEENPETHEENPETHEENPETHEEPPAETHEENPETHEENPETHEENPETHEENPETHEENPETHEEPPAETHEENPETHEEPPAETHEENPETHEENPETHEEHPEPQEEVPEEVPEKQYACTEAGVFVDPDDESSFFRCYLKSAHLKCAEGLVFNKERSECEIREMSEPELKEEIKCTQEGFYRNPFDCSKFYRCYYQDAVDRTLHIGFFDCPAGMVFDGLSSTCVPPERAEACHDKSGVHEPEGQVKVEAPEYDKLLHCSDEGYFRNPYDCNLFYRCFRATPGAELSLALFECNGGQVFDDVSKNCLPAERTAECANLEIPHGETHAFRE